MTACVYGLGHTLAMMTLKSKRARVVIKSLKFCVPVAMTLTLSTSTAAWANDAANVEKTNRQVITEAFERWTAGGTSFYQDVLSPDASWTIMGSGWAAQTYKGRDDLIVRAVKPISERLKAPIKPIVKNIWVEREAVIVLWKGATVACDGASYQNNYVWIFHMRNQKAFAVTAFLDLPAYYDTIARVKSEMCQH